MNQDIYFGHFTPFTACQNFPFQAYKVSHSFQPPPPRLSLPFIKEATEELNTIYSNLAFKVKIYSRRYAK